MDRKCGTCESFDETNSVCRIYPPQAECEDGWPTVDGDNDWCSQWRDKDEVNILQSILGQSTTMMSEEQGVNDYTLKDYRNDLKIIIDGDPDTQEHKDATTRVNSYGQMWE